MLIRPCSDLHMEFWNTRNTDDIVEILNGVLPELPDDKETVLIIAGDLCPAQHEGVWVYALQILGERFKNVLWVLGNHFYYNNKLFHTQPSQLVKNKGIPDNVILLENRTILIENIVFAGATLWTDFNGCDFHAMEYAKKNMNDFEIIYNTEGKPILPIETVNRFQDSIDMLNGVVFGYGVGKNGREMVVITHHSLTRKSTPKRYRGSLLNDAFSSNRDSFLLVNKPVLYIHGHTHTSFYYNIEGTRVICNPLGYCNYDENKQYDKTLTVEV